MKDRGSVRMPKEEVSKETTGKVGVTTDLDSTPCKWLPTVAQVA